jgi:hypothetical protein
VAGARDLGQLGRLRHLAELVELVAVAVGHDPGVIRPEGQHQRRVRRHVPRVVLPEDRQGRLGLAGIVLPELVERDARERG